MNAKDVIRNGVEFGHMLTQTYVGDLTDQELLVRAVPGSNHAAWQLGHLIVGTGHMLAAIGRPGPQLPLGFENAYSKETSSSDDPKGFAAKAEYLNLMEQAKAASLAAIDATDEKALDEPGPESMRQYAPTVGAVLALLGAHWTMHAGQFVPIRRKLGKPAMF